MASSSSLSWTMSSPPDNATASLRPHYRDLKRYYRPALELIFHIGILPRSISLLVNFPYTSEDQSSRRSVTKAMNRARGRLSTGFVAAGSTCRIVLPARPAAHSQPRVFRQHHMDFSMGSSDGSLFVHLPLALTCRSIRPTFRQSLTTGAFFLRPSSTAWFWRPAVCPAGSEGACPHL